MDESLIESIQESEESEELDAEESLIREKTHEWEESKRGGEGDATA